MQHRRLDGTLALCSLIAVGCSSPDAPPPTPRSGAVVGEVPSQPPPTRLEPLPTALSGVRPPTFEHRIAPRPPPPLSGGTLLVLRDDRTAVASDPDLDLVWVVDLHGDIAPRRVALSPGDEPGRVVEDAQGRVHVALRRGGALVTIDAASAEITSRRAVCAAPRGLAWDGARLHVACAGGELVTLPAEGAVERVRHLETDLRDVVVRGDALYVTQFRSAQVFEVRGDAVRSIGTPSAYQQPDTLMRRPAVAWRAAAIGDDVVMLHESALSVIAPVLTSTGGAYGSALSPTSVARVPMITRLTTLTTGASPAWSNGVAMLDAGLAVDVAARIDARGRRDVAVASPGWAYDQRATQVQVAWIDERGLSGRASVRTPTGQAVAVAWTRAGALVVQTRASGSLLIADDPRVDHVRGITLYDEHDPSTRDFAGDLGHDVFHATTPAGIACASCHPEGGDDGRVWTFADIGRRRTPSLRGGVMKTAPFHWDGDLADVAALAHEVFTRRMGGPTLSIVELDRLGRWLDTIPVVPASPPADAAAVSRGEALFHSPSVACDGCHSGAGYTNNASVAVGTGGNFQVPPLTGLWLRAPYMHDGRATTLAERFTDLACGGDAHGFTTHLTAQQRADLVAFLETL